MKPSRTVGVNRYGEVSEADQAVAAGCLFGLTLTVALILATVAVGWLMVWFAGP